jgi:hypothetical protein
MMLPAGLGYALVPSDTPWGPLFMHFVPVTALLVYLVCAWMVVYLWAARGVAPGRDTALSAAGPLVALAVGAAAEQWLTAPAVFTSGLQTQWGFIVSDWAMLAASALVVVFAVRTAEQFGDQRVLFDIPALSLVLAAFALAVALGAMAVILPIADPDPLPLLSAATLVVGLGSIASARTIRALRCQSVRAGR